MSALPSSYSVGLPLKHFCNWCVLATFQQITYEHKTTAGSLTDPSIRTQTREHDIAEVMQKQLNLKLKFTTTHSNIHILSKDDVTLPFC